MYLSLAYSYWLTLALALPTGGFLVRIFIIQHDCSHGSFFQSKRANEIVGCFASLLTMTPFHYWRKTHSIHHASAGNLEHRGVGDVYTMTVREYQNLSAWGRFKYRLYRNPIILFGILPILYFAISNRLTYGSPKSWKRERAGVHWTNATLAVLILILGSTLGFVPFLLVHLPVFIVATSAGMWLFFVQHQFEDAYWADGETWDYTLAALQGSSYYELPKVLQWFTGNIGFHHIHHLSPRIPNYMLEKCHRENPLFQEVVVLTLWTSFKTVFLSLWDEEKKKLITFSQLKSVS
jgi:omega-6 fatty acid desaturase (delta-12 desaturase)